jgi:hypothetical protein
MDLGTYLFDISVFIALKWYISQPRMIMLCPFDTVHVNLSVTRTYQVGWLFQSRLSQD